jgi:hypothetical protein
VLLGFWTACPLKIRSIRSTNKTLLQGVRNSGNASRFGTAAANIEAYTDTRWITVQSTPLPMSSDPSIGVDGRLLDVRHDGAVFTDRAVPLSIAVSTLRTRGSTSKTACVMRGSLR